MSRTPLEKAHSLLLRRKFSEAIAILEADPNPRIYKESFAYYMTAGISCLYLGDTGTAGQYFRRAREIRVTDPTLLNAQAVLFLRRGNTNMAIQYYLDVLQYDPKNKIALDALDFVKNKGSYEEICRIIDNGEIEKFYPPLGLNPDVVKRFFFSALAGVALAVILFNSSKFLGFSNRLHFTKVAGVEELYLKVEDRKNPVQGGVSGEDWDYILTEKEVLKTYDRAVNYWGDKRENASQVEVNRLLNSNASEAIKEKARILASYFKEQSFGSLLDIYDYETVAKDIKLYEGCWVSWSGRAINERMEDGSYSFDLLIGDEDLKVVAGVVPVTFDEVPYPPVDTGKTVVVFGRIQIENGRLVLKERSIYQPVMK